MSAVYEWQVEPVACADDEHCDHYRAGEWCCYCGNEPEPESDARTTSKRERERERTRER